MLSEVYCRASRTHKDSKSKDIYDKNKAARARDIIVGQCPELADQELSSVGGGSVARTYRMGKKYFKFADDVDSLLNLDREWATLFILQKAGLPVAQNLVIGKKAVFFGMDAIDGVPLGQTIHQMSENTQKEIGREAGQFMIGMAKAFSGLEHLYKTETLYGGGRNKLEADDLFPDADAALIKKVVKLLRKMKSLLPEEERDLCIAALRTYAERLDRSPPVMCHADMHKGNILVREGKLAAVIDFGELAWDRMERWCYSTDHCGSAFREGVYETLLKSTDPFVDTDMKRNIAAYRLCAHALRWEDYTKNGYSLGDIKRLVKNSAKTLASLEAGFMAPKRGFRAFAAQLRACF